MKKKHKELLDLLDSIPNGQYIHYKGRSYHVFNKHIDATNNVGWIHYYCLDHSRITYYRRADTWYDRISPTLIGKIRNKIIKYFNLPFKTKGDITRFRQ